MPPVKALIPSESFAPIVKEVMPSVVTVLAGMESIQPLGEETTPLQNLENRKIGSGFILDADGHILTNNHVVGQSDYIFVELADENILKAFVVGRDPQTDIALLKVKTDKKLSPISWADSNSVQVGDLVISAGNPFGLGLTVSTGIISARSRDLSFGAYDDFLQTDAAIHQGNSGGPLFNIEGRVIGMNTALFAPKGENIGLNFAIPSNTIIWVTNALLKEGIVRRGKLGLKIQDVPQEIRSSLNLSQTAGAYVSEVVPNGETEDGKPKFILNLTVPRGTPGQDGTGSGNVYVAETGLVSGKQYLFQPGANNSPNGVFVEYVPPSIPEQVQPDWNATEGKGAILNKPAILPEAPKDGKQYARKDGAWEEVEAGDELSKSAIEEALTGNITTHRHDTTYNYTDFETDVWDGTSISTSLQGSGTKDDPYLIQSCADWLHLRANGAQYKSDLGSATEFKPYFKVNKNLDFGNKAIPGFDIDSSVEPLLMCVFDGSGAKLSNFVDSQGTGILPPSAYYFAHDFVIDNLHTTADASNGYAAIFSTQDLYSAILNCTVNASVTLTGSIVNPGLNQLPIIVSGEYPLSMSNEFMTEINSYVENNGCCCGINISITDNTTKSNDAKIVAVFSPYFMLHPIDLYCSVPLDDVNVFGEELPQKDFTVTIMLVGSQPACLYTNSEGTNKINGQDIESQTFITFTGTPKSLTEMQSAAFVEELNSHLPKPAFRQDPEGGTPILAGGNATIAYDGYVKKSEFESFKAKLNVNTPVEGSPFVDIEMASKNFPTDNDTVELTPEQYSIIDGGLKEGKMLRIKAKCGIFFGSTTTLIPFDASGDITTDKMEPSVLIWSTVSSVGIGSAHIKAVQMSVYISHTPNDAGNYVATFYEMKGDFVLSEEITTIKKLTQSEYEGLSSKDSKTLYVIVG